jgi:ribosome-associated protein YbcJ (S4-like RNA binding protein)
MGNPITTSELAAALDSLILQENGLELQDEHITIGRLAKQANWNSSRAKRVIAEWEKNGTVECVGERREPTRGGMVKAWVLKQ